MPQESDPTRFFAIVPTAFSEDGHLDSGAVRANVAAIAERGVEGALLTGSYGEFQSLTDDERVEACQKVVAAGTVRSVMAGAAAPNTATARILSTRLADAGADLIMVSAPFSAELSDDDLVRHFHGIADAVDAQLVIYNNPVFGRDLTPEVLERVTEHDRYVAIKQGTRSLPALVRSIWSIQAAGRSRIFAASDLFCAAAIGAGAFGVTSTNVWVFPRAFLALADPRVAGVEKARIMHALAPYASFAATHGQPHVVKAAMTIRGYTGGAFVREPYLSLHNGQRDALTEVIATVDASLESTSAFAAARQLTN